MSDFGVEQPDRVLRHVGHYLHDRFNDGGRAVVRNAGMPARAWRPDAFVCRNAVNLVRNAAMPKRAWRRETLVFEPDVVGVRNAGMSERARRL